MLPNCCWVLMSLMTLFMVVEYVENACSQTGKESSAVTSFHCEPQTDFSALLSGSSALPPAHSAVQSPAIQRRSPVERRMKMIPCRSPPPPQRPATSLLLLLLHSWRRVLHPAACLPALASGAWRKCHSLFLHCKVGRSLQLNINNDCFWFEHIATSH